MSLDLRKCIGVDLEATGADRRDGHRPIQLGLAVWNESMTAVDRFSSLIAIPDDCPWSEEAALIHNIPRAALRDAPSPATVAEMADAFLVRCFNSFSEAASLIPVGFNVAAFDVETIRHQMPTLAQLFSHRAVELNSPLFTFEAHTGRSYSKMKDEAKAWAATKISDGAEHDAGYDAEQALWVWKYIQAHAEEWSVPEEDWKARTAKPG